MKNYKTIEEEFKMQKFTYKITDELGIHARPAGLLVKTASDFQANIKVRKGNKEADAKRLFSLMSLAVKKGEEIELVAEGTDEAKAIVAMEHFLKTHL